MPRDGSGVASPPPGTFASPNTTILSSAHNALRADTYQVFNTFWPVALGGNGVTDNKPLANSFGIRDNTDLTKLLVFDLSGLASGTKTLTIPANGGLTSTLRIKRTLFTSSGTFTPDAKMLFCFAQAQAPGGGAGGVTATAPGSVNGAGGGGSGSYSEVWLTKAQIGASQAVSIGAIGLGGIGPNPGNVGGTVSLGSLISANGGGASGAAGSNTRTAGGGGGSLGIAGFSLGRQGDDGSNSGSLVFDSSLYGGAGADSMLGFGGRPNINGTGQNAITGYGGGGGGASDFNNTAPRNGGNGGPGIIIVTEYCSE